MKLKIIILIEIGFENTANYFIVYLNSSKFGGEIGWVR